MGVSEAEGVTLCFCNHKRGTTNLGKKHLNGQQYEELNLAIYKKKASIEVADLSHILQTEHLQTLQG